MATEETHQASGSSLSIRNNALLKLIFVEFFVPSDFIGLKLRDNQKPGSKTAEEKKKRTELLDLHDRLGRKEE